MRGYIGGVDWVNAEAMKYLKGESRCLLYTK